MVVNLQLKVLFLSMFLAEMFKFWPLIAFLTLMVILTKFTNHKIYSLADHRQTTDLTYIKLFMEL